MRSTSLDSFQSSMVNSITVCGRTLLNTVEHLLDHAERKEPSETDTKKTFPGENTICITSGLPALDLSRGMSSSAPFCNIALVTEEVIETMFLGQGRFDVSLTGDDVPGALISPSSNKEIARRRTRFLIVDIADFANLDFSIPASSYARLVMNLLGNALKFTESGYILVWLRSHDGDSSHASVTLKINDSGVGMSREFLFNDAFEPFRKYNQYTAGTGVGLNVVQRIIEDVGGSIEITSEPDKGTDVTLKLPMERHIRVDDPESPHSSILNGLSQLRNRRICILHSKSPDEDGPSDNLRHWGMLKRYIDALLTTLRDELKMDVTVTSEYDGDDTTDIVICPEVSFESLQRIRDTARRKPPATVFITMDTMEADTLRCDARVMSKASVVEVMTQPCGPYKLGMVLGQCLKQYDGTNVTVLKDSDQTSGSGTDGNDSGPTSQFGPRLGLYSSKTLDLKSDFTIRGPPHTEENHWPAPSATEGEDHDPHLPENVEALGAEDVPKAQQVLIVDDNAINRRLLSIFMKKRKLLYKEANDGLQALERYKDADGKFDVILMDISMPVMDGMTSTRLIREHENNHSLKATHIIALTGLTSASARLEAWTSGVDDFLTKPVDFKQLERLMKAGRGSAGTGFLSNEESKENVDAKLP
ncbi:hypothetical protein N0V83_002670 [Neocucurbitaria cava]|uniref:histidine kinase n=1 Tax=Neocucurbitaria cava TaxID=798079 RepID=A0A9W8YCI6_9PLEO|nr:hypothetical protein N0V83_002670 [Neocucurbitaria cava]